MRLYDRLFDVANPLADKEVDFLEHLNPESLKVISDAVVEPGVAEGKTGDFYQFERLGYFTHEKHEPDSDRPILNRTVTLRDSWARKHGG